MDKPKPQRDRARARLGLIGGIVLVVLVGQLLLLRMGVEVARWSYDLPFISASQNVSNDLVMVYLDAKVKSQLGQPPDKPLDRRFYAQLLGRLKAEGAKLVLFDILFDGPQTDSNTDIEFAAAIRQHGKVVLVGDYVQQWQGDSLVSSPVPPIDILKDAAAGWGLANVVADPDLEVRVLSTGTEDLPSVDWVAASLLDAETTRLPKSRLTERWVNYFCEPTALRTVNLDQALATNGVPAGFFRDQIVIVGSRREGGVAGAERDEFRTPYAYSLRAGSVHDEPMAPGAAIHAFTLLNLIRGDWLTRLSVAQESAVVLIWGILISVVLLRLRPWTATLVAPIAFCAFALIAIYVQRQQHLWFSWLVPAGAQTSVALIWSVGFQYLVESRRRRKLRQAFAAYLSPHMADRIADSDFDLALGGKEVHATIMFTDLEGFTSMTENMAPAEVSRILISYFTETTRAILEKDGTIIKYMGDAVMAVWGAPLENTRSAQMAVEAALGMRRAGGREISGRRFRTRIGINSGPVLAGNLGSEFRFDYSLIGETTNVASRLESLNKVLGTDILITQATRRELDDDVVVRLLGQFVLAGTTRPIAVYEVLGMEGDNSSPASWLDRFASAREHFTRGEFDVAERLFREMEQHRGIEDGPIHFYLREIARIRATPGLLQSWDGIIRLDSK